MNLQQLQFLAQANCIYYWILFSFYQIKYSSFLLEWTSASFSFFIIDQKLQDSCPGLHYIVFHHQHTFQTFDQSILQMW